MSRGGAGISKVVRPLQIKYTRECGQGVYNRQRAAVKLLVESKCVGADAVRSNLVMHRLPHEKIITGLPQI